MTRHEMTRHKWYNYYMEIIFTLGFLYKKEHKNSIIRINTEPVTLFQGQN
ncbi:predicted protein [Staphylococcus aureus A9754]|nr:predicted protein [Staphylococcus aureus A9754]